MSNTRVSLRSSQCELFYYNIYIQRLEASMDEHVYVQKHFQFTQVVVVFQYII